MPLWLLVQVQPDVTTNRKLFHLLIGSRNGIDVVSSAVVYGAPLRSRFDSSGIEVVLKFWIVASMEGEKILQLDGFSD
jgi:hypothetical protein